MEIIDRGGHIFLMKPVSDWSASGIVRLTTFRKAECGNKLCSTSLATVGRSLYEPESESTGIQVYSHDTENLPHPIAPGTTSRSLPKQLICPELPAGAI
jgi:hypothetical protein